MIKSLRASLGSRPALVYLAVAGLLALHLAVRWALVQSAPLAQADYDESITGLMALHWLRGDFQAFFWGQPYMGTLEPFLASLVFRLVGPSTLALHFTLILVSSCALLAVYGLGKEAGGQRLGLLAALYWALPPLFLTFDGLYATGGHLEAITAAAVVLYGCCRLAFRPPRRAGTFGLAIGLVAGLGWWCSLLVASLLAAANLGMLIARPRLLRTWTPWLMLAGFLLGSAPFWWWNITHDFMTFRAIEPGDGHLLTNLVSLLVGVWLPTALGAWWDHWSVQRLMPSPAVWGLTILVYLPALSAALAVAAGWLARLARRRAPLQGPLDLVAATLLAAMLAHAASSYGSTGFTRYAEALYVPLAVMVAYWLCRALSWRRAVGAVLVIGLCAYNLSAHALFLDVNAGAPWRTVDGLRQALADRGITHAYAQGRVAYPLTFESGEQVICADYFGWRNYDYLQAVDAAARPAIITHEELGTPWPSEMKAGLRMLGAQAARVETGPYLFWHDFRPPPPSRPLPSQGWRIGSSQGALGLERSLADRDLSTTWPLSGREGDWLVVDLGQPAPVSGVTLLPGPRAPIDAVSPVGIRLEGSADGSRWEVLADGTCLAGLVRERGQPRFKDSKALEINFAPRLVRQLRVARKPAPDRPDSWPLAEIFVRRSAGGEAYQPQPAAVEAFRRAEALAQGWRDEPMGPHPRFPGVPPEYRLSQVDWLDLLAQLRRASLLEPDWEAPALLLLEWLGLGHLEEREVWPDWRALVLESHTATALPAEEPAGRTGQALATGDGVLSLRQGLRARRITVEPAHGQMLALGAGQSRVEAVSGQTCLRALRTPLEVAAACLDLGDKAQAAAWLERAGDPRQDSPAQLFERARCWARLGRLDQAQRILERLRQQKPGWIEGLGRPHGGEAPPWPEAWVALAGHESWLGRHPGYTVAAAQAAGEAGQLRPVPDSLNGLAWRMAAPAAAGQALKVWFPQYFLRGRYLVSFRVRGNAPAGQTLAVFSVLRHFKHRLHDEPARLAWNGAGSSPDFQEVVVPVVNELEPVKLEAAVTWQGQGEMELDQITVYPDLGWDLANRLHDLGLDRAGAAGAAEKIALTETVALGSARRR